MDYFHFLIMISKLFFTTLSIFPNNVSGNIWSWILNHPLQSDSSDVMPSSAFLNDSDGITTSPHRPDNESSTAEEFKVELSTLCQNSKPCGRGKFCDAHYGKCERLKRRGDFCRKDSHCQRKHECVFGRCRKEIPKGQEGSRCADDTECSENHCCARQHGEHVCKPRLKQSMKCFIPAGGLDYSLNEQCPCETGLTCQYEPVKPTTQTPGTSKNQKNEWYQFSSDTAHMKCLPIPQLSTKTIAERDFDVGQQHDIIE